MPKTAASGVGQGPWDTREYSKEGRAGSLGYSGVSKRGSRWVLAILGSLRKTGAAQTSDVLGHLGRTLDLCAQPVHS
jgi:hypothetical protein